MRLRMGVLAIVHSFGVGKERTEDFVAHIVLSDEISEEFLVDAGAVGHLTDGYVSLEVAQTHVFCPMSSTHRSIPKGTPQFDGLEEHDLGLLGGQGCAHCRAHAHGAEAGRGHPDAPKRNSLDHFVLS